MYKADRGEEIVQIFGGTQKASIMKSLTKSPQLAFLISVFLSLEAAASSSSMTWDF